MQSYLETSILFNNHIINLLLLFFFQTKFNDDGKIGLNFVLILLVDVALTIGCRFSISLILW